MAAETARAHAEQRLQELRAELEKLRLHNDVVLPATAKRKAAELKARGQAAPAIENGNAAAEALKLVANQWALAGDAGRDVYILQQLPQLAAAAAARVAGSEVGNIKLVAGDDEAYGAVLASYPAAVARVLRETGAAIGIDIDRLLSGGAAMDAPPPGALPAAPALPRAGGLPAPPGDSGGYRRATAPGMPATKDEGGEL